MMTLLMFFIENMLYRYSLLALIHTVALAR
jgi:hypothetical protein